MMRPRVVYPSRAGNPAGPGAAPRRGVPEPGRSPPPRGARACGRPCGRSAGTPSPRCRTLMLPARRFHGLQLRPRRHAEPQHRTHRPDGLRQASRPGRRPRVSTLGRTVARGRLGCRPRRAQAVVAWAQGQATPSDRRPRRPDAAIAPLHAGRIERPAAGRQARRDRRLGAAYHAGFARAQAPPARDLDPLGIEPRRQGPPTRLGRGALGLPACRRPPGAARRPHRGAGRLEAVGQANGHPGGGPPRDDLRPHALGQGPGAGADIEGEQPRGDRSKRPPPPRRRTRPAVERLGRAARTSLDRAAPGAARVELAWGDPQGMQQIR
jgi:hypothetical protein